MAVELTTIEGVELCATGTYPISTGVTTFTAEDLAAAVQAAQDPTVPSPRIKIGHDDPRYNQAVATGELDGEPAFGTVANLRLSADGQKLIGDFVNVPAWLADSMQSAFPGRSIEGRIGFDAPSGRNYEFAVHAVALLGVTWPGVTSLPDLQELLEKNGTVEDPAGELVEARVSVPRSVKAGLDIDLVRRRFYDALESGEFEAPNEDIGPPMWWWVRSMRFDDDGSASLIVDDDEGHLLKVSFAVSGNDVSWGEISEVVEQYVAAAGQRPAPPLGQWESRAASRPNRETEGHMPVDLDRLRQRLGLPEGADEAAINAELAKAETPPPPPPPDEPPPPDQPPGEEPPPAERPGEQPPPDEQPAEPPSGPVRVPEGMALVDAAALQEMKEGAALAKRHERTRLESERDDTIDAAIKAGRFPRSRKEHYAKAWDKDPKGTRELIAMLPEGMVPTEQREIGAAGDGETTTTEAQGTGWFPQLEAQEA